MNSNERAFSKWIVACTATTTVRNYYYYYCLDLREKYKQCELRHKSKSKREKRTVIMIHKIIHKYCRTKQRTEEWEKNNPNPLLAISTYIWVVSFFSFQSNYLKAKKINNVEDFHWAWFYGRDMMEICICSEDWNETEETMDADERKMLDGSAFSIRCESKTEQI